ncbi:MAG: helicase-associated domain-containing protein [Anaerolineae bacterium]|nr:helicase-associated domain-containing protein [Anaerolineae bacterium]
MRDLYRCLDEYSPQLLQGIASAWGVSLPQAKPLEVVKRLAQGMLSPQAAQRALETLSPEARRALAEILSEGSVLPGHRLALRYGSIRRLGPARLEREQPWLQPENTLEELFYKGFLYRAYGSLGEYYGELFFIPAELAEILRPLVGTVAPEFPRAEEAPARILSAGRALIEDLFLLLVRLRQGRVPVRERVSPSVLILEEMGLGARLWGEDVPERLELLWGLLQRLRLIEEQRGIWQPSQRAKEWLTLTDAERLRTVFMAWRDDPHRDELSALADIRYDKASWPAKPALARRNLLELLAKCPAGEWLSLEGFVQVLRHYLPDYLRPDGDFAGVVYDAKTGEPLRGLASWEKVEGALARYLLAQPLYWLGIVDIGYERGAARPSVFRLTMEGRRLLTGERLEGEKAPPPQATLREDFTVSIPLENTLYERYQLERFAEWQAQDGEAIYRITAESIWRSQNAGIKVEQILNFLRRISQGQVPPVVVRALRAWGGRFGRVFVRRVLLLQTDDEQTMKQIRRQAQIRPLLGEAISPTACLVEEENLEKLTERLKSLGIWPHIRL